MKRSNVKRHFHTCHTSFASKYPEGDIRKGACLELLRQVKASQQQLRAWSQKGNCNSASFAASLAIVKNGKPFTDGEYAKIFMLDVANELFEDLSKKDTIIKRIKDVPLSARTVHDRAIMMANEVEEIQLKDINKAELFSLAFDESTDVSHLSQFSVIARYVVGDTLREENLAVLPLKGTTRGEDLFRSFMEFATEKSCRLIILFQCALTELLV
ncbi:SCAN domain-containing protein 3-like [Styela clava]